MMKSFFAAGLLIVTTCVAPVFAQTIPLEDFTRSPLFTSMRMSPDGEYVAFLHEDDGHSYLYLMDMPLVKRARVEPGTVPGTPIPLDVANFHWITDKRVIFTEMAWDIYLYGVSAVDRDGKHGLPLTGFAADPHAEDVLHAYELLHSFRDKEARVLMLDRREMQHGNLLFPHVVEVDTQTGAARRVLKNPGNVVHWGADREGVVRAGITFEGGTNYGVIYRENAGSPWRPLLPPDNKHGPLTPLGFDYTGEKLYVAALSEKKREAVYLVDPAKPLLGEPILEDPEYDVIPEVDSAPTVDGIPTNQLVFSKKKQGLVGIRYLTTGPRVVWFDPEFASYQQAIDQALPGMVNVFTSRSDDEKKIMVLSYSDRNPGRYYLFDAEKKSIRQIGARMPWIKPDQMAPMKLLKYPARDGVMISAYLTLPVGHPPKNLPLIVLPHGGPWARDVWVFDPLVQFLANRGYAVLQMNYRGSIGYGSEFSEKARREIGRGIQNDIEDGTRWAIDKGVADPQRIAIMGASYGGYSALFALGKNPELYRCGISIAGVSDWLQIIQGKTSDEYKLAYEHWVEQIGDPKVDHAFLESISPVNFAEKIAAPVLIIQGKDDRVVPPKQAKLMTAALEKAGRKPESLFLSNDGHGLTTEKARTEGFQRIEAFLLKNLGPGVAPVIPTPPGK